MKSAPYIAVLLLVLTACSRDEDGVFTPHLTSPEAVTYDARCQTDTISFSLDGDILWKASTDGEWLTLEQTEGTGAGRLPIYIQQNDDEEQREATVTISVADGSRRRTVSVKCMQSVPSENGYTYIDLPKTFGLGWGYDLSADIADASGLRGQVFDAAALRNDYGDNVIRAENSTHTNLYYASGNSHEEMQREMNAKVAGKADIFVAKAKVSVEYSNQISEKIDRRYMWCRDLRAVKTAYFYNLDYGEENLMYSTTWAFRNAVKRDTPQEFVRKFGTHLVIASCLGGKLDYYFTVSQSVKTEVERIITCINVKVLCFKKSWTNVDENVWTEVKKDFKSNYEVTGGGQAGETLNRQLHDRAAKGIPLESSDLFDNWSARFKDPNTARPEDLAMIDFEIIPIWEIVEVISRDKAAAIEEYVTGTYLK